MTADERMRETMAASQALARYFLSHDDDLFLLLLHLQSLIDFFLHQESFQ